MQWEVPEPSIHITQSLVGPTGAHSEVLTGTVAMAQASPQVTPWEQ